MFAPMRAVIRDPEGKVLLVSAATMIAVGTVVYHVLEGWSFLDLLYFSVVTLATVGYGDFHPTTDVARLFTVGYILVGIGILAAFASELTKFRKAERLGENARLAPAADPASDIRGSGRGPAGALTERGRGSPGACAGVATAGCPRDAPRRWWHATSRSRSGSLGTRGTGCGAT